MRGRESAAEYVVKNGKRKAVILPIEEYEELLEDLYDLGVIASRRHEPTIPFEDVLRRLKKNASVKHRIPKIGGERSEAFGFNETTTCRSRGLATSRRPAALRLS